MMKGHNLTDQQTDLLLELEPQALLVASATLRTAPKLVRMIERLRDHGWDDDRLVTAVKSSDVVAAGMVKSHIALGGYETSLELTLDPMMEAFCALEGKARDLGAPFRPKAIYVCQTNKSQDDGSMDNPAKPFRERRSAPILIWRHLTESAGIDPSQIAVYCDLKFDKKFRRPDDFVLFSGGDDDYAAFSEGNFWHIIFNLTLQEGWDDPECCFAYIDKSMGSNVQIEQVIGRVLRQPGAQHYSDPDLNTAEFFVRMDRRQEFAEILRLVQAKIAAELPETKVTAYTGKAVAPPRGSNRRNPGRFPASMLSQKTRSIPSQKRLRRFPTIAPTPSTRSAKAGGSGRFNRSAWKAMRLSKNAPQSTRIPCSHGLSSGARFRRSIRNCQRDNWADPKFDARIQINSRAAQELRDAADQLVDLYLDHTRFICEAENPHQVGPVMVRPEKLVRFNNALHEGYSDLNPDEEAVARCLDQTGYVWARNPSAGGFSIPLLDRGRTRNFFPDFLVWKDDTILAIDPKGEPYLATDAGRKLLSIRDENGRKVLIVRLITSGRWNAETLRKKAEGGYTAWTQTNAGTIRSRQKPTIEEIISVCLDTRF